MTIALSFLSSLGVINFVIDQAIEIEISSCNAVGTLFRQDSTTSSSLVLILTAIHTCVLDTYIKKIGSKYLNATLKPFVHEILEKRPECLLDTTDVSKDGLYFRCVILLFRHREESPENGDPRREAGQYHHFIHHQLPFRNEAVVEQSSFGSNRQMAIRIRHLVSYVTRRLVIALQGHSCDSLPLPPIFCAGTFGSL